MAGKIEKAGLSEVMQQEDVQLRLRREKLFGKEAADKLEDNRFGIALSGGGIRSATINLGFLRTLNYFDLIRKADYLSTVSGGGYTGSYIHATLKNEGSYQKLFSEEQISYMRSRGEYLFPGTGLLKVWNQFILAVGYLTSLIMSLLSPAVMVVLLVSTYKLVTGLFQVNGALYNENLEMLIRYGAISVGVILLLHYISNISLNYNLTISGQFNKLETGLVGLAVMAFLVIALLSLQDWKVPDENQLLRFLLIVSIAGVVGFFTNPNATSFHRFYRKQLSEAFLHFSGIYKNVNLFKLFDGEGKEEKEYLNPYPLINTCLNLQSSNDPNFKGTKASDYFLLSPFYCGSKLTGYVKTSAHLGYSSMTLPAATTISAAALNPGMGIYSNKMLSLLLTIFNARLGYWTWNPLKWRKTLPIVWWPMYFFYELFSRIGTDKKMLNISDGGHIENLAVYELLRRKCKLIVSVDAGEDPEFLFADLENLTIRARNELGIEIRFRRGQDPEDIIRPKASYGYSRRRFAIADLYQLWEKVVTEDGRETIEHYKDKRIGILVYVKSSVTAPEGRPDISPKDYLKYGTYKYKIYHPVFPHEPTSDQFFDEIQWESYYQLGQYIAADVLGIPNLEEYQEGKKQPFPIERDQLFAHFDEELNLFVPVPVVKPVEEEVTERGGLDEEKPEVITHIDVGYKM